MSRSLPGSPSTNLISPSKGVRQEYYNSLKSPLDDENITIKKDERVYKREDGGTFFVDEGEGGIDIQGTPEGSVRLVTQLLWRKQIFNGRTR